MKKGDIIPVKFEKLIKLNTAAAYQIESESDNSIDSHILTRNPQINVKNVIPGKTGKVRITKKKRNKIEGRLIEYTEPISCENLCENALRCGGCTFNIITPEEELKIKTEYLESLFKDYPFEGLIESSPNRHYRNKMEYSFGNEVKDGELTLGLHEKGQFYNILNTDNCQLVPEDFEKVRKGILNYLKTKDYDFFHKHSHNGFLRYLVLRRGEKTGDILVNLVTTSTEEINENELVETLLNLELEGQISGILWTISDNVADAVNPEQEKLLYGNKVFEDRILDKSFKITPYSFFQVNTSGADQLFKVVQEFLNEVAGDNKDKILFDLFSGTGSIGILLADQVKEVYGIELIPEAVEIAKENAKNNNIENINFISGDVFEKVEELETKADIIILDPPRYGITPKALKKILKFNPEAFIYVSCNPVELKKDLPEFEKRGYSVKRMKSVNLFPMTTNVETVCLLVKS